MNDTFTTDSQGVPVLTKTSGKDFRILQLTDIHMGGSLWTKKKDKKSLAAIEALVKYAKPDLVAVTGDVSFPMPHKTLTINNMRPAVLFGTLMEKLGIPWTFVFGNHDCESFATHTKKQIAEYYYSCPHCLFKTTAEGITGDSNYVVKLRNQDGTLNQLLIFIDSNGYAGKGFFSGFDYIHDDQVDWYEKQVKKVTEEEHAGSPLASAIPSMAFFHIPLVEYRDAWWALQEQSPDAVYNFGCCQEKDQYFGTSHTKSKMFDKILELGSTKAVFVGHDHYNTQSVTYKGIQLTYGMSIDYLAYDGISKRINQRGATIIDIHDDSTFHCQLLPLTTVTGEPRGGGLRH